MLSLPRARVQSLVGELRSHKPRGVAEKERKTITIFRGEIKDPPPQKVRPKGRLPQVGPLDSASGVWPRASPTSVRKNHWGSCERAEILGRGVA